MLTYYLIVIFTSLLVGMECRSIVSTKPEPSGSENDEALEKNFLSDTNVTEGFDSVINLTTVNEDSMDKNWKDYSRDLSQIISIQGPSIENLLSAFVFKGSNITDKGATFDYWLKQLKPAMNAFSMKIARSSTKPYLHENNRNAIFIERNNWLDGLREIFDAQYFDKESTEENETSNIDLTLMDSSTSESSLDQSFEKIEDDSTAKNVPYQLDNQVNEFQEDISDIQKHYGKLCRKHRTAQ